MDDFVPWSREERRAFFMKLPVSDAYFLAVKASRKVMAELVPYLDTENPLREAALDEMHSMMNGRRSQLLPLDNAGLFEAILAFEEEARRIRAEGWTPPTATEPQQP